jgi:hypothetical protein
MNKLIPIIVVALVVGGGSFYGGMKYAESKNPRGLSQGNFQNMQNLSPEERQQRIAQLGANGGNFRNGSGGGQRGGGFTNGEILTIDITL